MEVSEMNKTIAEFMGLEICQNNIYRNEKGFLFSIEGSQGLKYHESYDQLMTVWEKFRDLKIKGVHKYAHTALCMEISKCIIYKTRTLAHESVYEACKWYNQLNK